MTKRRVSFQSRVHVVMEILGEVLATDERGDGEPVVRASCCAAP